MTLMQILFPSDSINEAEFEFVTSAGNRVPGTDLNRMFHERDSTLYGNNFSSVEWRLNGSGQTLSVRLIKGNAFICEIKVLTFPGETRSTTTFNLFVTKSFFRGMR